MKAANGELRAGALLWLGLILAYWIYRQGISGTYLLDDFQNLKGLGQVGSLSWDGFKAFLDGSQSGVLGRPLSVLSFFLQFHAWPSSPADFKQFNILLHLANASLLCAVLVRLAKLAGLGRETALQIAVFAAVAWALHPINLSSVLYVVQRMALLSTFFVLLGLLLYLSGRERANRGNARGLTLAGTGLAVCSALAFLSKETGILLFAYCFAIEAAFASPKDAQTWRRGRAVVLYGPAVIAAVIAIYKLGPVVFHAYQGRDFSLGQRLLTNGRVLADYLRQIVAPQPAQLGLFHDDFPASTSLLAPLSTLWSWLALLAGFALALRLRRRLPEVTLGAFWFVAGHLLESSVIPLELYFEHRNYLPAAGPIFALGCLAFRLPATPGARRATMAAALAWLALLAVIAAGQGALWGRPLEQASYWAAAHPDSKRAQSWLGGMLESLGRDDLAQEVYQHMARRWGSRGPGDLNLVRLACRSPVVAPEAAVATDAARNNTPPAGVLGSLEQITLLVEEGRCRLDTDYLLTVYQGMAENPYGNPTERQKTWGLRGRLLLARGRPDQAAASFEEAERIMPTATTRLLLAGLQAGRGDCQGARRYLDLASQTGLAGTNELVLYDGLSARIMDACPNRRSPS